MDPMIRYRRQRFLKRRIETDRPLLPARMYEGGRPVVLAELERHRALEPVRTVPISLSELRRQVDLERGMWDDRRDIPSALVGAERPRPLAPRRPGRRYARADMPTSIETEGLLPSEHLPDQSSTMQYTRTSSSPEQSPSQVDNQASFQQFRGLGQTTTESPWSPHAAAAEYGVKPYSRKVTAVERPRLMRTPALLSPVTALRGVGALDSDTAKAAGVVILGLAVGGGYFAGAAMAPANQDKVMYGVLGSVLGLFAGPIGLGVLGLIALSRK